MMRPHTEDKPFFRTILRTRIAEKKFCFMQGGPHNADPYVSETYGCFRHWNAIPASLTFPLVPTRRKVSKGPNGRPVTAA